LPIPNSGTNNGTINNNSLTTTCNCSIHDLQLNGIQTPCNSINCVRNRTSEQSISATPSVVPTQLGQRTSSGGNSQTSGKYVT